MTDNLALFRICHLNIIYSVNNFHFFIVEIQKRAHFVYFYICTYLKIFKHSFQQSISLRHYVNILKDLSVLIY
jgi:hypothetical protein